MDQLDREGRMGRKNRPRTEKRTGKPPSESKFAKKTRERVEGTRAEFEFRSPQRLGVPIAPKPAQTPLTLANDPTRVQAVVSDTRKVKLGYLFLTGPGDVSIHLATYVLRGRRVEVGQVLDCTVQLLVGKTRPTVTHIHKIMEAA